MDVETNPENRGSGWSYLDLRCIRRLRTQGRMGIADEVNAVRPCRESSSVRGLRETGGLNRPAAATLDPWPIAAFLCSAPRVTAGVAAKAHRVSKHSLSGRAEKCPLSHHACLSGPSVSNLAVCLLCNTSMLETFLLLLYSSTQRTLPLVVVNVTHKREASPSLASCT